MTIDEMIEAVARAIFACHFADTAEAQAMMQKAWNRPSPLMTMVHNEARAAIRVIAPAVLDEAIDKLYIIESDVDRMDTRAAIRAMKTRYEQ